MTNRTSSVVLMSRIDARATPDHRVCGLGSSYTFSGQLIAELWQLDANRSPLYGDPKLRPDVKMSDVDFEYLYGGNSYAAKADALLAGGCSLIPLLKFRLADVPILVDLRRAI